MVELQMTFRGSGKNGETRPLRPAPYNHESEVFHEAIHSKHNWFKTTPFFTRLAALVSTSHD